MSAPGPRPSHRITWAIFVAVLILAMIFIAGSASGLPDRVASHFDAAGDPNAFMPRDSYVRLMLAMAVGLPALLVALLTAVYSRAKTLKVPHREYWLAPERIESTRAFLVAHGVWFGILLAILVCFVQVLELHANRLHPSHLSNERFGVGMLVFLLATGAWIATLMVKLRRPR